MFVYNLTIKVDREILPQWIKWIKEEYIPGVMATDLFSDNQFFELLDADDDTRSSTFVIQHFTDSREKYNKFINHHSHSLTQKSLNKWKDYFFTFSTLMQTVH